MEQHVQKIIQDTARELAEKYPLIANYESRSALWRCGLKDGSVSEELIRTAEKYYGGLWHYVGD